MTRLVVTGLVATLGAMVVTTVVAAVARSAGVDLEVPDGADEAIPVSGVAVMTGLFSVVGLVLALGFRRWSSRPARRFAWTAAALTALSLAAPLVSQGDAATVVTLVVLHVVAAAVVVPALVRALGRPLGRPLGPSPREATL